MAPQQSRLETALLPCPPSAQQCRGAGSSLPSTALQPPTFERSPRMSPAWICRCPNPRACAYKGRRDRLRAFTHSIACHNSTAAVDGTVTWTAVHPCPVARLAQSLQQNATMDMSQFDIWMDRIPQCARGYQGLLCGQCMPGFGRGQASFTCSPCPSTATSLAVMLAGVAAVLLVSWYTIHQASMAAEQPSEVGSFGTTARGQQQRPFAQLRRRFSRRRQHVHADVLARPGWGGSGGQGCCESTQGPVAAHEVDQDALQAAQAGTCCSGGYLQCPGGIHEDLSACTEPFMSTGLQIQGGEGDIDAKRDCNSAHPTGSKQSTGRDVTLGPIRLHSSSFVSVNSGLRRHSFRRNNAHSRSPSQSRDSTLSKPLEPGPCTESAILGGLTDPAVPHAADPAKRNPDNVEFQVAKIMISYLQVVSVIRDVDMQLPEPVQTLFQVCLRGDCVWSVWLA